MIRNSIVSGQFYPSNRESLNKMIEAFKPKDSSKISAKGVILPHAGYIYSGKVAVVTLAKVLKKTKIIILGPNHSGLGAKFGLWAKGSWKTPYGNIEIDEELAQRILDKEGVIAEDYLAHQGEHSIEVELPILKYFFKEFKFVPIACSRANIKDYQKAASQIFEAIKNEKEDILVVVSTDLTHYEPDASARRKDRLAIDAIVNLDEENLVSQIRKENITMCGEPSVSIALGCLKKMGARKSQVILYQTSGDTSGDYSSVVGYTGMVIS